MARFFALATAVVVAVALADLITHASGTATVLGATNTAEKNALNAELGVTS